MNLFTLNSGRLLFIYFKQPLVILCSLRKFIQIQNNQCVFLEPTLKKDLNYARHIIHSVYLRLKYCFKIKYYHTYNELKSKFNHKFKLKKENSNLKINL